MPGAEAKPAGFTKRTLREQNIATVCTETAFEQAQVSAAVISADTRFRPINSFLTRPNYLSPR
jgi:hypothetical protein